jgi:hypothetical protein
MDEETRNKLEMGRRALEFCRAHPDSSPEYVATVARLKMFLARAEQLELREKNQRKPPRTPRGAGSNWKVLPLKKGSKGDQTDPAQRRDCGSTGSAVVRYTAPCTCPGTPAIPARPSRTRD